MYCNRCGADNVLNSSFCCRCGIPFAFVAEQGNVMEQIQTTTKEKFYTKAWFIIPVGLILPPIGIILLWVHKKFDKVPRILLTTLFISIIVVKTFGSFREELQTQTSAAANNTSTSQSIPSLPATLATSGIASNVKITVLDSYKALTLNKGFSEEKAKGVFRVVKVKVENNQRDAISVDSDSFALVDRQNREFSYSYDGKYAVKDSLTYEKLNPGLSVEGNIVFDVPVNDEIYKLRASGGMTGDRIFLKLD